MTTEMKASQEMTFDELRELDAQVAVKVMGWNVWESKHGYFNVELPTGERYTPFFGKQIFKYDPETGKKLPKPNWWEDCQQIPFYSTDIGAAWEVIDVLWKLRSARIIVVRLAYDRYRVEVGGRQTADKKWVADVAEADTAPLAICRAALLAVKG